MTWTQTYCTSRIYTVFIFRRIQSDCGLAIGSSTGDRTTSCL